MKIRRNGRWRQPMSLNGVKTLTEFGSYKDGGSLGARFECDDVDSELFFQINYESVRQGTGASFVRTFTGAYLKERFYFQWVNKVGETIDDTLDSKLVVSWGAAKALLAELEPQMNGFVSEYRYVFDEMVQIAESQGIGLSEQEKDRLV